MTQIHAEPRPEGRAGPRIIVVGVGGAGGNAINNMIQGELSGMEFLVANTDAQAIGQSRCGRCIRLGQSLTQGLGAGSQPEIGRAAAEEAIGEIAEALEGAHMVFITAGMGGGTGTGAAPVIARAARAAGALTVGVVTKPFRFEGVRRMRLAEAGIQELAQQVDTLVVIPNQNLIQVVGGDTVFTDAFKMADQVLHLGVRGVTDLVLMPGLINLDFADIRAVMVGMGRAIMGTGEAEGDDRAIAAAEAALTNPLIDEISIKGAPRVLINITGGGDLTIGEIDRAAGRIHDEVDSEASIIFGSTFDPNLDGRMRVSLIATKIDAAAAQPVIPAMPPRPPIRSVNSFRSPAAGVLKPADTVVKSAKAIVGAGHHGGIPIGASDGNGKIAAQGETSGGKISGLGAAKSSRSQEVPAATRVPDPAPRNRAHSADGFPEKGDIPMALPLTSEPICGEKSAAPGAGLPRTPARPSAAPAARPVGRIAIPGTLAGLDRRDRINGDTNPEKALDVPSFLRRRD